MKTDFLKELGLEKEAIDKIMAENGKDIENYKNQVSELTKTKDSLTAQLTEANKQIEGFKELDIDGIKKAADDYKQKFEAAEAKAKADLDALKFDTALTSALSSAKAKNIKAVKALLDMEGLKLVNDKIDGLETQLKKVKEDNDYLFESDSKPPRIVGSTGGGAPDGDDAAIRAIMGLPVKKEKE